jgi:hypothetical protein
MIDKTTTADFRSRMYLDPGDKAAQVAHEPSEGAELPLPEPMRQPVNQNRVKAGISKCDFPRRPRGRVAVEDRLDIFLKGSPHDGKPGQYRNRERIAHDEKCSSFQNSGFF